MANTFHWTLPSIMVVTIHDMYKLVEQHNEFIDRQNKEMNKAKGNRSGKTSIGSLGQLKGLPGVRRVNKAK